MLGFPSAGSLQSFGVRTGLLQKPGDLDRLEEEHANSVRFLEGSQRRLKELEQAWFNNRGVYQQKLERQGEEIRQARRSLGVIEENRELRHLLLRFAFLDRFLALGGDSTCSGRRALQRQNHRTLRPAQR